MYELYKLMDELHSNLSTDAHQTPIQISRTTAYSEPHTTSSLPLFIESQLPTTLNTTYGTLCTVSALWALNVRS